MSGEVTNDNTTKRVEQTRQQDEDRVRKDNDTVRRAADDVDANRVAARLGDRDGYKTNTDGANAPSGTTPQVQLASLGLPVGLFNSGSPIDSRAAVRRMGELGALGNGDAGRFDRSRYRDLISPNPGAPFTGSGATGDNPTRATIPIGDAAALARYHQAERDLTTLRQQRDRLEQARRDRPAGLTEPMEQRWQEIIRNQLDQNYRNIRMTQGVIRALEPTVGGYRNPLSENPDPSVSGNPRDHWDERTRERQAELFLNQPISSLHASEYGDRTPTRREVIDAAARRYNLDPSVLAGVMLHEQRDQSRKEDAADFGGATLAGRDTSIGLGQILMSTAMRNNADLLSDTVDPQTRAGLSRNDVARLLTSDEHNIYATARYLRQIADQGARVGSDPSALPNTRRDYPGLDTDSLRGRNWNADTIRALASEYTSRPWDDRTVPPGGYPQDVLTAVEDIRRARIFP